MDNLGFCLIKIMLASYFFSGESAINDKQDSGF